MLKIAVVGHTNTGKTSLLRTLTRDSNFGEVADSPGTTRHVEGARLQLDGKSALEWFDTPGMEDSIALLEYLEKLDDPDTRRDGPARIRRFLDSPEAHRRYEQEARVLTKMLDCDAALYVIDTRDPVLSKYRDELALLAACGKPLLPILNFVNAPNHRANEWRDAMARLGLHAALEFDTIAPPLDGERQLYDKLAVLLDRHAGVLHKLAESLMRERDVRRQAAWQLAADLLVDVAALRMTSPDDEQALQEYANLLQDQVRRREQTCIDALLALYNFRRHDYAEHALPILDTRGEMDLFHPEALKDMGIQLGTGMAAGAMAGAAVDMLTAGLSLGTGTLIGAAAGGLWQGVERLGGRLLGKLRGYRELTVDDPILRLLALRQRQLINALEHRGHAAREPMKLDHPADTAWRSGRLPDALKEARSRPEWSALNERHTDDDRRKFVVTQLAQVLSTQTLSASNDTSE
jgi:hypothetical protein